jgi:divalent metal cation (Fe/Co/Zn/Cd) transporter
MVAVGVLIFAIIAEAISLWGCIREVNKERHGRKFFRWFRESRSSELVVVFGEDIAALLGLMVALIAIIATMLTGNPLYDAIGSAMIGVLLLIIAFYIAVEVKALLIGQSVEPRTLQQMRDFLEQRPEIDRLYNLLTMQMGHDAMVAVKARMTETGTERGMIDAINKVETDFKDTFPVTAWLFFEPDITDDE